MKFPYGRQALKLTALLWVGATACATTPDASPEGGLLLVNARIVDLEAQEVREGALLIHDGVIAAAPVKAPRGFRGEILDLGGKWVIPGLNYMHTHSYGNPPSDYSPGTPGVAMRVLAVGVTGMLDLFGHEDSLYQIRAAQHADELGGADLYTSLSCLTAPNGHCTEYGLQTRTMASPEEARAVVADLALKQPDVVKIVYQPSAPMPSIDKATFAAAVDEASKHGLKTIVHIGTWDEINDAIEVGATAFTHIPDRPIPEGMADKMAAAGIGWIPTMPVEIDYVNFVFDPEALDNPMARMVTTRDVIESYLTGDFGADARAQRRAYEDHNVVLSASVKAAADAGVVLMTGTDGGNRGTIQGYSVHRELMLMVRAGLTPWQALAASTANAGGFLGLSFGVNPGDVANLVVLDASPIDDIRNTQKIAMVIHRGEIIDREALLASDLAGLATSDAGDSE